ncbi:MAG: tetratricopeptide repeat protein [Akkermansiaceae bacterium]|nr:tetratricopeptide repeat protein [Armatimonadota bacterium]
MLSPAKPTLVSPLVLRLFGAFDARIGESPLPPLRSRKGLHLLALLALRQGRGVEREWLAGILWPDSDGDRARVSLRQTLTDLRTALGPHACLLYGPSPRQLSLAHSVDSDVSAFDAAIRRGDVASLEEAVGIYRGPVLETWVEEWVAQERAPRDQQYRDALATLGESAAKRGESGDAARLLRRLVTADPLREDACRNLMRAVADQGDYAGAMQCFRDLRLRLRKRFGSSAEPAAATQAAYKAIRAEARAKGALSLPQATATPQTVPSLPSSVRRPLPLPLTPLIGRESAVADVLDALAVNRLATLTGPGGIGKTRLALAVAYEGAGEFLEGAFFVDLAPVAAPADVARAVLAVLKAPEEPGRSSMEALTAWLNDRSLLLVLDNCEHLLDACAELTEALLSVSSGLRVLATSRQPLMLPGERVLVVLPLSLPDPRHPSSNWVADPALLLEFSAVRLFVDRATAARADFAINKANAAAVVQVCRRLDGIPLALELAASSVRSIAVEVAAARLSEDLSPLTGAMRTSASRHRTLQATFDWSWELLTPAERLLLARLSVFVGGWTQEAAEAVCGSDRSEMHSLLIALTSLVDKSLVVYEEKRPTPRYRLLETVRQYAAERLYDDPEGADVIRARHLAYLISYVERQEAVVHGEHQADVLDRLEADHDNCRAVLRWAAAETSGPVAAVEALRLAVALLTFWMIRDHAAEGHERLVIALARHTASGLTDEASAIKYRIRALNSLGTYEGLLGNLHSSRARQEEALLLARKSGNRLAEAGSLNNLGNSVGSLGDHPGAIQLLSECLTLAQELGYDWGAAMTRTNLGYQLMHADREAEAMPCFNQSLGTMRRLGDKFGVARALDGLAAIARRTGGLVTARGHCEEALALRREIGSHREIALSLGSLARVIAEIGEKDAAGTLCRECLEIRREMADRWGTAEGLEVAGELALRAGDAGHAVFLWGAVDTLRQEIHTPLPPPQRAARDRQVASARESLGDKVFEQNYAEGRNTSWKDALDQALGTK